MLGDGKSIPSKPTFDFSEPRGLHAVPCSQRANAKKKNAVQPVLELSMPRDVDFPLHAQWGKVADNGHQLYRAFSEVLSFAHSQEVVHVHPSTGRQIGERIRQFMPDGAAQVRTMEVRVRNGGDVAWKPCW